MVSGECDERFAEVPEIVIRYSENRHKHGRSVDDSALAVDNMQIPSGTEMNRRRSDNLLMAVMIAAVACSGLTSAAKEVDKQAKRARPPKWSKEVLDVFFEDAREKLVGARPNYGEATAVAANDARPDAAAASGAPRSGETWSKLIDAETIETEIKRLAQALDKDVTTPSAFKGGAYEDARRDFSALATLFAVSAEFDGEVRWKDSAAGLRELFARAARNCKVGNDQTYREALQRKQDLADLIGGSRPKLPVAEGAADWGQVADRSPLMQRINMAHEERLTKWLASEREFKQHRDDVRHEAQLLAAMADVIGREGFDYWDEEEYAKNARELRAAAVDISVAVELDNYEQARQAISRATKACADCHDLYRG
jgi:hypothetical protein